MKRLLSVTALFITLAILVSSTLVSCSKPISEEKALSVIKNLLTESVEINEIFFGHGLPYDQMAYLEKLEDIEDAKSQPGGQNGVYYPFYVPIDKKAKYQSENEIKEAALKVYSSEYCEYLFKLAFKGISSDSGVVSLPKYYLSDGSPKRLLVRVLDPDEKEIMPVKREYDLSTIEFIKIGRIYITFSVRSIINGEPADTIKAVAIHEKRPHDIRYNWYLDTPTY